VNLGPPLWLPLPERSRGDREEPHCSPGFVDRAYLFFLKLRTTLHQRDTDRFEAALTPFSLGPEGLQDYVGTSPKQRHQNRWFIRSLNLPCPRSGSQTTGHAWRCWTRDRPPEEWSLTPRWTMLLISRCSGLIPRIRPSCRADRVPSSPVPTCSRRPLAKRLHRSRLPSRHACWWNALCRARMGRCHPAKVTVSRGRIAQVVVDR
jgi:hypothetical protein